MRYNIVLLFIFCLGCERKSQKEETVSSDTNKLKLEYASGFAVSYQDDNTKLVEVLYPFQGAASGYKYLLVPKGQKVPEHLPEVKVISIPLSSIICTSTTHIPLLDYLDQTDKLVGFPSSDYISSPIARARIDSGYVEELGIDKGMNLERIAMLKPNMVMGYLMNNDYGQFKKIEDLNVPVVLNAEYLEEHPLGRAEWIKFMAVFFNEEQKADSVFQEIKQEYLAAKAAAERTTDRPSVLSGVVYSDAWFLPGGQNYAAQLLKDSGCDYLWADDKTNGFLELSFESVYEKAHEADLWIGVGSFETLAEIRAADHRYTRFKAFKEKQVYTSNKRRGAKGGSEFLELGYLRPDIILKDLLKIAHPELVPDHELYFHRNLE